MAKVSDSVDVILAKATRKYFPMVLFITLDSVLTFQSKSRNVWSYKWTVYVCFVLMFESVDDFFKLNSGNCFYL